VSTYVIQGGELIDGSGAPRFKCDLLIRDKKIAFMGQVPVKARGVVHIGDYLLPSGEGDGLAIAVAPDKMKARDFKRIIGVAWEAAEGKEFYKLVNTAVGLNQNDTGKLIEEMKSVINEMQKALQEVNPN
jgi:hypothetical protein